VKPLKQLFPQQRIRIIQSKERLSRRIGLMITHELMKSIKLPERIDHIFGKPGSNRGIAASVYVQTLISMIEDGATHLEEVNHLMEDSAYQEILSSLSLPGSDAIGDWLRRQGDTGGEEKMLAVMRYLMQCLDESIPGDTLDIDATIIESRKGDAQMSYKKIQGYQPLLGVIAENGFVVGSQFRQGNESPQGGLWDFVKECEHGYARTIKTVRSDSAGFNREMIENCLTEGKYFSITATHNSKVMATIESIPEEAWQKGYDETGIKTEWQVAETTYTLSSRKRSFRLVVKRTLLKNASLFTPYGYWIVASNLPADEYSPNAVILFHQKRGSMEKVIGELKHQLGLKHLPCGQFGANALYFTIGILAYNLLQAVKHLGLPPEDRKKSVRSLRYQLIHLAGKVTFHARYMIIAIAAPLSNILKLRDCFLKFRYSPLLQ
jgi:hypothetical protein